MTITFPLTIKYIQESESKPCSTVAYTPELDISSCGKNEKEAKEMLELVEISI